MQALTNARFLPLAAGLLAAGVATYFAIYARPAEDPNAKARGVGQEIHDKLAAFGRDVKRDATVAGRDVGRFFKGDYDVAVGNAMAKAHVGINSADRKAESSIGNARAKADDKIDASHLPPGVKAVAKFGVNVGTNVAKDAVKAAAAIANAGVTVGNDAVIVAQHAGADIGHVGVAIGDLFKHPGNVGHDLAPIADDFKHIFEDIKDAFHPHRAALAQITKMQQQYDSQRRTRETQCASDAIQGDVTSRGVPANLVQDALAQGAVAHIASSLASWTNSRISAQRIDKTTKSNVDAVAAIYQEPDAAILGKAAEFWKASGDRAAMEAKAGNQTQVATAGSGIPAGGAGQ